MIPEIADLCQKCHHSIIHHHQRCILGRIQCFFLLVCHLVKRDGLWLGKSQELEEQLKGNSVETLPRSRFGNMGRQHVSRLDQIFKVKSLFNNNRLASQRHCRPSKVGSKVWDGCSGPLGVGLRIPAGPAPAPGTSYDNSVIIKTFFLQS